MAVYSHSKLQTFEQCKLRYKLRYIDKIKPPVKGTIEAHLGTSVHNSLEWLYKQVMQEKIPELEDILQIYIDEWQKNFDEELVIAKPELTSEHYFNKGIKFITDYYLKHKPFKDGTIETEKKVWIKVPDSKNLLIGFIDRLVHNKEKDRLEVHDYKTANSLPNQNHFDRDRQLALYSIAIRDKYKKPVVLTWHYLNHNIQVYSQRTDDQLNNLLNEIKSLIEEIENTTEFPPNKSILCNWCEYKSICPAWGNKLPEKARETQTALKDTSQQKPDNNSQKENSSEENNLPSNKNNSNNDFPTASKYIK